MSYHKWIFFLNLFLIAWETLRAIYLFVCPVNGLQGLFTINTKSYLAGKKNIAYHLNLMV